MARSASYAASMPTPPPAAVPQIILLSTAQQGLLVASNAPHHSAEQVNDDLVPSIQHDLSAASTASSHTPSERSSKDGRTVTNSHHTADPVAPRWRNASPSSAMARPSLLPSTSHGHFIASDHRSGKSLATPIHSDSGRRAVPSAPPSQSDLLLRSSGRSLAPFSNVSSVNASAQETSSEMKTSRPGQPQLTTEDAGSFVPPAPHSQNATFAHHAQRQEAHLDRWVPPGAHQSPPPAPRTTDGATLSDAYAPVQRPKPSAIDNANQARREAFTKGMNDFLAQNPSFSSMTSPVSSPNPSPPTSFPASHQSPRVQPPGRTSAGVASSSTYLKQPSEETNAVTPFAKHVAGKSAKSLDPRMYSHFSAPPGEDDTLDTSRTDDEAHSMISDVKDQAAKAGVETGESGQEMDDGEVEADSSRAGSKYDEDAKMDSAGSGEEAGTGSEVAEEMQTGSVQIPRRNGAPNGSKGLAPPFQGPTGTVLAAHPPLHLSVQASSSQVTANAAPTSSVEIIDLIQRLEVHTLEDTASVADIDLRDAEEAAVIAKDMLDVLAAVTFKSNKMAAAEKQVAKLTSRYDARDKKFNRLAATYGKRHELVKSAQQSATKSESNLNDAQQIYDNLDAEREELLDSAEAKINQAAMKRYVLLSHYVTEWARLHEEGQLAAVQTMLEDSTATLVHLIAVFQAHRNARLNYLTSLANVVKLRLADNKHSRELLSKICVMLQKIVTPSPSDV